MGTLDSQCTSKSQVCSDWLVLPAGTDAWKSSSFFFYHWDYTFTSAHAEWQNKNIHYLLFCFDDKRLWQLLNNVNTLVLQTRSWLSQVWHMSVFQANIIQAGTVTYQSSQHPVVFKSSLGLATKQWQQKVDGRKIYRMILCTSYTG